MHKLKEMLYRELDEMTDSGKLDIDYIGKIVDAIKDIDMIHDDGYSRRRKDTISDLEHEMSNATPHERASIRNRLDELMRRY